MLVILYELFFSTEQFSTSMKIKHRCVCVENDDTFKRKDVFSEGAEVMILKDNTENNEKIALSIYLSFSLLLYTMEIVVFQHIILVVTYIWYTICA